MSMAAVKPSDVSCATLFTSLFDRTHYLFVPIAVFRRPRAALGKVGPPGRRVSGLTLPRASMAVGCLRARYRAAPSHDPGPNPSIACGDHHPRNSHPVAVSDGCTMIPHSRGRWVREARPNFWAAYFSQCRISVRRPGSNEADQAPRMASNTWIKPPSARRPPEAVRR